MKVEDDRSTYLGAIRNEFTCTAHQFSLVVAGSHPYIRAWNHLQGWVELRVHVL
jgi:hypothetical protein